MKRTSDRTAVVGPVRLSYLNCFAPRANELKNGVKEYSTVLLFPKENCEQQPNAAEELKELNKLLRDAVFAKWGDKPPSNLRRPIRDGDTEMDASGDPKAPGYYFMNVTAKEDYPPLLVDGSRKVVTSGWNSGDWGNVEIAVFAYDTRGNKGVSAGLRAIQFLYKGEPMGGGGGTSASVFDEVKTATAAGQAPDDYDPFADE